MTQERKRDERCCCYCIVSDSPSGGISKFPIRESSFLCIVALICSTRYSLLLLSICFSPIEFLYCLEFRAFPNQYLSWSL
jgi:hypothetical protein